MLSLGLGAMGMQLALSPILPPFLPLLLGCTQRPGVVLLLGAHLCSECQSPFGAAVCPHRTAGLVPCCPAELSALPHGAGNSFTPCYASTTAGQSMNGLSCSITLVTPGVMKVRAKSCVCVRKSGKIK